MVAYNNGVVPPDVLETLNKDKQGQPHVQRVPRVQTRTLVTLLVNRLIRPSYVPVCTGKLRV